MARQIQWTPAGEIDTGELFKAMIGNSATGASGVSSVGDAFEKFQKIQQQKNLSALQDQLAAVSNSPGATQGLADNLKSIVMGSAPDAYGDREAVYKMLNNAYAEANTNNDYRNSSRLDQLFGNASIAMTQRDTEAAENAMERVNRFFQQGVGNELNQNSIKHGSANFMAQMENLAKNNALAYDHAINQGNALYNSVNASDSNSLRNIAESINYGGKTLGLENTGTGQTVPGASYNNDINENVNSVTTETTNSASKDVARSLSLDELAALQTAQGNTAQKDQQQLQSTGYKITGNYAPKAGTPGGLHLTLPEFRQRVPANITPDNMRKVVSATTKDTGVPDMVIKPLNNESGYRNIKTFIENGTAFGPGQFTVGGWDGITSDMVKAGMAPGTSRKDYVANAYALALNISKNYHNKVKEIGIDKMQPGMPYISHFSPVIDQLVTKAFMTGQGLDTPIDTALKAYDAAQKASGGKGISPNSIMNNNKTYLRTGPKGTGKARTLGEVLDHFNMMAVGKQVTPAEANALMRQELAEMPNSDPNLLSVEYSGAESAGGAIAGASGSNANLTPLVDYMRKTLVPGYADNEGPFSNRAQLMSLQNQQEIGEKLALSDSQKAVYENPLVKSLMGNIHDYGAALENIPEMEATTGVNASNFDKLLRSVGNSTGPIGSGGDTGGDTTTTTGGSGDNGGTTGDDGTSGGDNPTDTGGGGFAMGDSGEYDNTTPVHIGGISTNMEVLTRLNAMTLSKTPVGKGLEHEKPKPYFAGLKKYYSDPQFLRKSLNFKIPLGDVESFAWMKEFFGKNDFIMKENFFNLTMNKNGSVSHVVLNTNGQKYLEARGAWGNSEAVEQAANRRIKAVEQERKRSLEELKIVEDMGIDNAVKLTQGANKQFNKNKAVIQAAAVKGINMQQSKSSPYIVVNRDLNINNNDFKYYQERMGNAKDPGVINVTTLAFKDQGSEMATSLGDLNKVIDEYNNSLTVQGGNLQTLQSSAKSALRKGAWFADASINSVMNSPELAKLPPAVRYKAIEQAVESSGRRDVKSIITNADVIAKGLLNDSKNDYYGKILSSARNAVTAIKTNRNRLLGLGGARNLGDDIDKLDTFTLLKAIMTEVPKEMIQFTK